MAQAGPSRSAERPPGGVVPLPKRVRLLVLRQGASRREGSLAAALIQSMALAVMSTAGAYPSWVLVTSPRLQVVLGASWALSQADPPRDSLVLGPSGGTLMVAIAFCCLLSVVTASAAIALDFLGRRKCRRLGPLLHGLTALLVTGAAALGSNLLVLVRGRVRTTPELRALRFAASPGQSLFLSFLACALASTATGLSCSSPALVAPARSSRDVGRARPRRLSSDSEDSPAASPETFSWQDDRFFDPRDRDSSSSQDDEERPAKGEWYGFFRRELAPAPWRSRAWRPPPPPPAARAAEGRYLEERRGPAAQEEERALETFWEPQPRWGVQRGLALPQSAEEALHTRPPQGEKEPDQEDPGRGDAELQLSLAPECQRAKGEEKPAPAPESQAAEGGLVESQGREQQDAPTFAL